MKVTIASETIEFLPERAFFWPTEKLLGFSDVHLGKVESYQKLGIPVPTGAHQEEFERIENLINKFHPKKILILGDWIHQKESWTQELFLAMKDFFESYQQIHWILLMGNHDRGSKAYFQQFPIEIADESYQIGPFLFTHGHQPNTGKLFLIEGHVHPVITLRDGPLKMRFPSFVLSKDRLLIPSFGQLTGGFEIPKKSSNRIFAVTQKEVFEVRA